MYQLTEVYIDIFRDEINLRKRIHILLWSICIQKFNYLKQTQILWIESDLTFWWLDKLEIISSRWARLALTALSNGWIIFFITTVLFVNSSCAQLKIHNLKYMENQIKPTKWDLLKQLQLALNPYNASELQPLHLEHQKSGVDSPWNSTSSKCLWL